MILCILTPDRRQSETLMKSTNVDKIVRNRVYDCHFSPDWRQMAIENSVSSDSVWSSFVSTRRLAAISYALYMYQVLMLLVNFPEWIAAYPVWYLLAEFRVIHAHLLQFPCNIRISDKISGRNSTACPRWHMTPTIRQNRTYADNETPDSAG